MKKLWEIHRKMVDSCAFYMVSIWFLIFDVVLYGALYGALYGFLMLLIWSILYIHTYVCMYVYTYIYIYLYLYLYLNGFYMLSSKSCSLIWFRMGKLWENLTISEGQVVTNPCCASRDRSPSGYLLLCFIVCSFVSVGLGSTYTIPFGPILYVMVSSFSRYSFSCSFHFILFIVFLHLAGRKLLRTRTCSSSSLEMHIANKTCRYLFFVYLYMYVCMYVCMYVLYIYIYIWEKTWY